MDELHFDLLACFDAADQAAFGAKIRVEAGRRPQAKNLRNRNPARTI
jgi:hypothetical protein